MVETGRRVAVVGSGPAGLSAAFYLRRAGHAVTVFERLPEPGGMLMYAIPSYRLPQDVVMQEVAALEAMGVVFRCGVEVGSGRDPRPPARGPRRRVPRLRRLGPAAPRACR